MADLIITITIPDAARADFLDAYAERFGYNSETDGTKVAFARSKVRELARDPLRAYRRSRAEAAALATVAVSDDGITSV